VGANRNYRAFIKMRKTQNDRVKTQNVISREDSK
jgi:hypothetical protein